MSDMTGHASGHHHTAQCKDNILPATILRKPRSDPAIEPRIRLCLHAQKYVLSGGSIAVAVCTLLPEVLFFLGRFFEVLRNPSDLALCEIKVPKI